MKIRAFLLIIGILMLGGCSALVPGEFRELTYEQVQMYAQQTLTVQAHETETAGSPEGLLIRPVIETAEPEDTGLIIYRTGSSPTALPSSTAIVLDIPSYLQPTAVTYAPPLYVQPTAVTYATPLYVQPVNTVCDRVRFIEDVTIPDDTRMAPGQVFRKIWRIQNAGSCTWTAGYQLVFYSGDSMGDNLVVNLPSVVAPGETVDVGVDLTAPWAYGVFQSNWKLRSPSGTMFGTSNSENDAIWARIVVGNNSNFPTVAPNVTPGNTGCMLISVDPAYRTSFGPGEEADFSFRVRNDSGVTWDTDDFDVAFIGGENMLKRKDQIRKDLPNDVAPGTTLTYLFDAVVPDTPGVYTMTMGIVRGYEVFCTVDMTVNVVY